ncbi:MAG: DUF4374 domain-containing protein [Rikenellaceae bacterium]
MKKSTQFLAVALAAASVAASCTSEVIEDAKYAQSFEEVETISKFIINTQVGDAVYLMTTDDLSSGTITSTNNGTESNQGGTVWQWIEGKYVFSIKDLGGNDGAPVRGYFLNAQTGKMELFRAYSTTKYNSWGSWGDNFLAVAQLNDETGAQTYVGDGVGYVTPGGNEASSAGASVDGTSYYGKYLVVTQSDPNTTTMKVTTLSAEGYLTEEGSGETITIPSWVENGGYIYASIATTGVTKYALENNAKDYIGGGDNLADMSDYVSVGWGSKSQYGNTLTISQSFAIANPLTPNTAYIAVYNKNDSDQFNAEPVNIITTDKMGQAFGRYTGNPLNTMAVGGDGYLYVFSPGATRKVWTDAINQYSNVEYYTDADANNVSNWTAENKIHDIKLVESTNPGSVMRIAKGNSTEFDASFDVKNVETALGGYAFTRVWAINGTQSKFLLRVLDSDKPTSEGYYYVSHKNTPYDTRFAVYDAATGVASYIADLPEQSATDVKYAAQTSIAEPYSEDGVVYIPLTTNDGNYPRVFYASVMDENDNEITLSKGSTITATVGVVVQTDYIVGIGKLTGQNATY